MKHLINAIKDYCTYNYESIAVAENITTGCLQMLLGSVDHASTYFQGGITTLTNQQLSAIRKMAMQAGLSFAEMLRRLLDKVIEHEQEKKP